jgi:glucokinase
VDNDANVGTLGEALHGAGHGHSPVFYCTLGSGVGGGLVVGGRIFHGAIPGEVEFGHLRLDRQGTIVEARCSGWAVDARIRECCGREPGSTLARLTDGMNGGEARWLIEAVKAGDSGAQRILDQLAEDLAFALSHVTHLLHPEVVVLGGGLGLMGEALSKPVGEALPRCVMKAFAPGPKVVTASLGEDAIPIGALALAAQAVPLVHRPPDGC